MRYTLMFTESLLRISGTEALTSSNDLLSKSPASRSFWPMSNVYKAFRKYSSLGISFANKPPVYTHTKIIDRSSLRNQYYFRAIVDGYINIDIYTLFPYQFCPVLELHELLELHIKKERARYATRYDARWQPDGGCSSCKICTMCEACSQGVQICTEIWEIEALGWPLKFNYI